MIPINQISIIPIHAGRRIISQICAVKHKDKFLFNEWTWFPNFMVREQALIGYFLHPAHPNKTQLRTELENLEIKKFQIEEEPYGKGWACWIYNSLEDALKVFEYFKF